MNVSFRAHRRRQRLTVMKIGCILSPRRRCQLCESVCPRRQYGFPPRFRSFGCHRPTSNQKSDRHVLHRKPFSLPASCSSIDNALQQKELTHTILLHPSYFGPRMLQYLESKLYSDVEGTCSGQFGYIISVVNIKDVGKGMIIPGTGQAEFIARYQAVVFKPFKGEVVDGIVNNVNRVCLSSLCHSYRHAHLRDEMGFFVDVGPLTVFVSAQVSFLPLGLATPAEPAKLVHPDMKFDPNSNPPSFASEDQASPSTPSFPSPHPCCRSSRKT